MSTDTSRQVPVGISSDHVGLPAEPARVETSQVEDYELTFRDECVLEAVAVHVRQLDAVGTVGRIDRVARPRDADHLGGEHAGGHCEEA